jgi:carboxyl-terminal processing protease
MSRLFRFLRPAAFVLAVVVAFGAGLVTGVVGNHAHPGGAGLLDEAANRIAADAAHPVDRNALNRAAIEGMLKALGDPWSAYYTPGEYTSFADAMQGRYSGIGAWIRQRGLAIEISSVQPGSPAQSAGLRVHDVLTSVDGHSATSVAAGTVVNWLRGRDGSTVSLGLVRAGVPIQVSVQRMTLTTDDVQIDQLAGNILRIKVAAFTRGVGREVRAALAVDPSTYSGGIVLDLRDDPGGLLDEAVEVASAFLASGPVVSYQTRMSGLHTLNVVGSGDTTTPLVVLVDGATASAAEVVAAALQDRNRAVVVGSRTYGKGSVQVPTKLSDGSAIELTVGRYLTPNGRIIDGKGIEPDVLVDPSEPRTTAEQRAIEVLSGLVASLPSQARG